ncbi:helix-turn-helix domain-containing protein [Billgrantia bachuensis]|uniref:Helix-turn-helix domain-containing protein n=1 Tax=Billgrantia bachuensis TaxID=2717286 RepID=A0ABX0PN02_9GAMM|nr:helix-turn-helix domain-containing protein [Halomonas bachuensis]NIC03985.1 helix-turn-helix domain-containing protein [Halomonas bachuensis]
MNTIELLTKLRAHYGGASDYRVAKELGIQPQTVYHWKSGRSGMSDDVGIRAAEILGLDPDLVLLDLHIEREEGNVTSPIWRSIRNRLEVAAMPVVVGFAGYWGGVLFGGPLT